MITTGGDMLWCADDQEAFELVAAEPVQLVFEAVALGGETTGGQVIDRFAFNGEAVLKAKNRIVPGVQRSPDSFEFGENQLVLFAAINHDHRSEISQFGKAAQGRQRRKHELLV